MRWGALVLAGFIAACGASSGDDGKDDPAGEPATSPSDDTEAPASDDGQPAPAEAVADPGPGTVDCGAAGVLAVGETATPLATASDTGEHTLVVEGASASATSWGEKGNEALVLEVTNNGKRVGHIVMHQGKDKFSYAMHVGALAAGDALEVKVSPLSAPKADKRACLSSVTLQKNASEGVANAPIMMWPKDKSFDDLPVLVGWSKKGKSYQLTYTNENGGTCALCGGGAKGVKSEIARWGRALDMESGYHYGSGPVFERCTGTAAPRMQDDHPVLYYGDGHNRLFESRGGYGQACGTSSDKMANGKLAGWNDQNPGNEAAKDDPYTIVLRPVPVDVDAVPGRESLVDHYAPWLYRLTSSELERENKIDDSQTFGLERYLFVDVYAADVGGQGDATCGFGILGLNLQGVSGGFVLRVKTKDGKTWNGPQMTADFFSGTLKRLAIPIGAGVKASDVSEITFDAYDGDGIYWLALGDAFIARKSGDNSATLEYVNKGKKNVNVYVDDDNSSCVDGKNTRNGVAYPCAGSLYTLKL